MADSPPDSLPSSVEETLARCPKFRILVVGNTGVGKSSLIASIFNIKQEDIDIVDGRAGRADINREYTSDDNPRFILHDTQGFEPGEEENWRKVKDFIVEKGKKTLPVKDRLHVIWLCIETPRTGMRLTQTADEELIKLAVSSKIPIIFVFTKYDILFNECYQKAARATGEHALLKKKASEDAQKSMKNSVEEFRRHINQIAPKSFLQLRSTRFQRDFSYVEVSTEHGFPNTLGMLENLTRITRQHLRTEETFIPWAVAQRIDPMQKVSASIEEGFKRYWKDLGKSTVFKDHFMKDCLWRIHLDIVEVWNFRDPQKLLSREEFRVGMLELTQPFMPQPQSTLPAIKEKLAVVSALGGIFTTVLPPLAIALGVAGVAIVAVGFLYDKYKALPETALCLEAYIVDLTLILHDLLQKTLREELTCEFVSEALRTYKETRSERVHQDVRNDAPSARGNLSSKSNKEDIKALIYKELPSA